MKHALGVLLCLAGCASAIGPFQAEQVGAPVQTVVTGRSLTNLWAPLRVAQSGQAVAAVGHTSGGGLWKTIVLPSFSPTLEGLATDAAGLLWVVGRDANGARVVRVHPDGTLDDFSAALPTGAPTGDASIMTGAGAVFVSVSVAGVASLFSFDGTNLVAVAGFPSGIEARVLAVVGAQECFLWHNSASGTASLLHDEGGVFTTVQPLASGLIAAGSTNDLWLSAPSLSEGSALLHWNGQAWSTVTISGFPKAATDGSLDFVTFVPTGGGQGTVIMAWQKSLTSPTDKGGGKLEAIAMTAAGGLGAPADLFTCATEPTECNASMAGRLADDTLVLLSASQAQWFHGTIGQTR